MKRSIGSLVALHRNPICLLGVLTLIAVVGVVGSRTGSATGVKPAAPGFEDSAVAACQPFFTEVEPNGDIASANALPTTVGAEVRGGITPAGDLDHFSFQATAGERLWVYVVTAGATPSTDSVVTLFASNGTTVIQLDDDNGSQSSLSSAIAGAIIPTTGTYYLQVRQFGGATVMNPYVMYIDRTSGAAIAEVEPNSTRATANAYSYGTVRSGAIPAPSPSTDLDYYTFNVAQNERVVIQVDGDPDRNGTILSRVNQFNPNFDLRDAVDVLIPGTAVDSDSQGGNGGLLSENLLFTNSGPAATFAIRIGPDPSTPIDDDVGIYSLHIFRVCPGGGGARAPFDFDGDGKSDISIFRPSVAQWWINRSSNGTTFAAQFGASTDRIVPADYTGDGKTDIAVWRPTSGEWFVLRSEDFSFYSAPFGAAGDTPVPADYDADGKSDIAVFRPSSATWFITRSSGGTTIEQFGANGDQPVAADYDGDGRADLAIFRPSNGQWWLNRSTAGVIAISFGASTDKLVQGDYTGDGKADVAFWRPSTGNWFVLRSEDFSFFSAPFGTNSDIPAPGDYDGDGKYDFTVFRPSSATWFSQRTTAGTLIQQFGATGDTPVANAFVR